MSSGSFGVGSIVRCREREWVVLPSYQEDVVMLRPLAGGEEEVCGVSAQLMKYGIDTIASADCAATYTRPNHPAAAIRLDRPCGLAGLAVSSRLHPHRAWLSRTHHRHFGICVLTLS
mgnify:CR=1 FL=1